MTGSRHAWESSKGTERMRRDRVNERKRRCERDMNNTERRGVKEGMNEKEER